VAGLLALCAGTLAWADAVPAQEKAVPDWENPGLTGIHKEPPHASMVVCPTIEIARSIRWTANDEGVKSPWRRSLNGSWRFHYSANRLGRVANFFSPQFDDGKWPVITVPGAMETQGYGVPIYVNIRYPWTNARPPVVPDDDPNNSVGAYRRTFVVPPDWKARPVFMTFDGVYSMFYLWVNGQRVGMSKESRSPAEFNITKYLKPGKNMVAAEVYRVARDRAFLEAVFEPAVRATKFIEEVERLYNQPGAELPRFIFIHLPNDHMAKPRPWDGFPFSASYVADNDYALGRMVEYLSHSPWWKRPAGASSLRR